MNIRFVDECVLKYRCVAALLVPPPPPPPPLLLLLKQPPPPHTHTLAYLIPRS